jgi:uncharacterized membrane protein
VPIKQRETPHRQTHREASLTGSVAAGLLIGLGVISFIADWELLGLGGWIWFAVFVPEAVLIAGLVHSGRVADERKSHRRLLFVLWIGVLGNLVAVLVLVAALLEAPSSELSAPQILTSGAVVWVTNVIVFGLCFWTLDAGGPAERAGAGRRDPDFRFPQDEGSPRARDGWQPSFEDYLYVAMTNGIAFSPTDAMPLTLPAKRLMALESLISVAAVVIIAARAVNVIGASRARTRRAKCGSALRA